MFWIWASVLIASIPGRYADTFSFDMNPLSIKDCSGRPPNNCGPRTIRESDCAFLEPHDGSGMHRLVQEFDNQTDSSLFQTNDTREPETHITLHCDFGHSVDIKKEDLTAQVKAIRKRSPRRSVGLDLRNDTFLEPETFAPISHQIVSFSLLFCRDPRVTSRLPFLNFTNLMDFTLDSCAVSIVVRKVDFSYLQKIRLIQFGHIFFDFIELGTFTDLPDLRTFSIKVYDFSEIDVSNNEKAFRLRCHSRFAWLWDWLAKHPSLRKDQQNFEVHRTDSVEGNSADDMLARKCTNSSTITIAEPVTAGISIQLFK